MPESTCGVKAVRLFRFMALFYLTRVFAYDRPCCGAWFDAGLKLLSTNLTGLYPDKFTPLRWEYIYVRLDPGIELIIDQKVWSVMFFCNRNKIFKLSGTNLDKETNQRQGGRMQSTDSYHAEEKYSVLPTANFLSTCCYLSLLNVCKARRRSR